MAQKTLEVKVSLFLHFPNVRYQMLIELMFTMGILIEIICVTKHIQELRRIVYGISLKII